MTTKFLLGVAIVAFTTFCGRTFAKKYRQRKDFFRQLHEFNERFLSEIVYYRRPLQTFIGAYAYRGDFERLLEDFLSAVKENATPVRFERSTYSFLNADERRTIEDYFTMLGRGDSASQKGYFASLKGTLDGWQEKSNEEAKKYGDLYVKLGFLCGLLLLILIV